VHATAITSGNASQITKCAELRQSEKSAARAVTSQPQWMVAPDHARGAYWIERNGQSRSSHSRTLW
jgi:hypothetical protein